MTITVETSVHDLGPLSIRAYNALVRGGIQTVGDILPLYRGQLMKMAGMGRKSLQEIIDLLDAAGLEHKLDRPPAGDPCPLCGRTVPHRAKVKPEAAL